jgi:diacylglycerol kinase family enzyme
VDRPSPKPSLGKQLAAIAAIVLVIAVLIMTVITIATDPWQLVGDLSLMVIAVGAAWVTISRTGRRRQIAFVVFVLATLGLVASALIQSPREVVSIVLRLAMLVLAYFLARHALGRGLRALKAAATPGRSVAAATHGVLIMNLRSGGGKAERFGLAELCRQRGIEPVVLQPGDDLVALAHDAVDRGADVIGMAGGDGSQALVAGVAAERGVPMVVVPAGTRNHLALDLGLDRNDVVGALDAYDDAVERSMDLAEVNGRVFVNNVSLGLYAVVVSSPEYRDAKVDTTLSRLPELLGPGTTPFQLQFQGPDGRRHTSAHIVQVSNNPYRMGSGSRPRLDTGRLGVVTLELADDRAVAALLTALAVHDVDRFGGYAAWTTEHFEVDSDRPVEVGLDGEALTLDPPLRFTIRRQALRVRLPPQAIGISPAARALDQGDAVRALFRTAVGRPTEAPVTAP